MNAYKLAEEQDFVDIEAWQLNAATALRDAIRQTWYLCDASVVDAGTLVPVYELTCANVAYSKLAERVTAGCISDIEPNLFFSLGSFPQCYNDDSWWPAEDPDASSNEEKLNTPKGTFCACKKQVGEFVDDYFGHRASGVRGGVALY